MKTGPAAPTTVTPCRFGSWAATCVGAPVRPVSGLSEDKLYQGRDLAVTTDYRAVWGGAWGAAMASAPKT